MQQPMLTGRLMPLSDIRFLITYENKFYRIDTPELDQSHIHDCFEIYVNISGNVSFLVGSEVYSIAQGDVILTRPGDIHYCIYNENCIHEHFCLWITADSTSPIYKILNKPELVHLRFSTEQNRELFLKLFYRLYELEQFPVEPANSTCFLNIIYILLGNDASIMQPTQNLPNKLMEILAYMDCNFTQIKSLDEIQAKFYISSATLYRWFRQYIHLSPRDFLEAKRISLAEQLLRNGCSVTDAAYQAGFSDCSHFITVFKKRFGQTPFRYSKQLR